MKITKHYANIPKNASWNIFPSIWFQEKWLATSFCVYFCYCNMILFLCLLMSKMCHFLLRPSFLRNSQLGHLHSLSLILDAFFLQQKSHQSISIKKLFHLCMQLECMNFLHCLPFRENDIHFAIKSFLPTHFVWGFAKSTPFDRFVCNKRLWKWLLYFTTF